MTDVINTDICVIGAGSGGLTVAYVAANLGLPTVLLERDKMGGDCLNYGCVPSKALLAAGHAAAAVRGGQPFGVGRAAAEIDGTGVYDHVRHAIDAIAPNDSVERYEGFGVNVIQAEGRFTGPREVTAGDRRIHARRFVIATGSGPMVPPIPGLDRTPFHTNETIFGLDAVPDHLVIVGAGPIGIEMAQAHRQLGAKVTVLEMADMLPNDDPELVEVVRQRLKSEGVELLEGVRVAGAAKEGDGIEVDVEEAPRSRITGSHLLIAAGRQPHLDGLDLEAAGIEYDRSGIKVDARMRTTNKKVFAIGDVAGGLQFTHVASYHAGIVIKNALFRIPAKQDMSAIPKVTYTSPELAQVGLTEAAAREIHGDQVRVTSWPFAENDRAIAERATEGLVKIVIGPKGRVLGAGIVGAHAGELIQVWTLAIQKKMKIGAIANMVAPYPTLGEAGKRAAGQYFTPTLFGDRTRKIVRFLTKFG